jgi:nucleoid-associated protein YgaU
MNTKVKVGIAAVIVAALVALIVLDQKTTPKPDAATDAAAAGSSPAADPNEQATRMRQEDVRLLIDKARQTFVPTAAPAAEGPKPPAEIKNSQPAEGKQPPAAPRSEEYVIQQGDTLETIAEAKYGSRSFSGLIAKANPETNPSRLRIGKKLALPPKPEKDAPAATSAPASPGGESPVATVGGQKFYTVQSGDTLSQISTRVYNTSRHADRIFEANRDRINDPHTLYVGTKLAMPDLPARAAANAATPASVAPTAAPAAAGKTHAVQQGDSLWKIAERYAAEKGLTVNEMIDAIIQANPEKLKDAKSLLKLGWQLAVPE